MGKERPNKLVLTECLAAPKEYSKRVNEFRLDEDEYVNKLDSKKVVKNKHWFRSEFGRDRDRISFSKAFRRLRGKTQIFYAEFDDHARTRLSHTLEVAQLSRTVAKNLNLDVDLAEAIALGHDIGHTPFGHVGESALNAIMNECLKFYKKQEDDLLTLNDKGFKHNMQSVRNAIDLDRYFKIVPGLNLTNFTLYGLWNHTKTYYKPCSCIHEPNTYCETCKSEKRCYNVNLISPGKCTNDHQTRLNYFVNKYNKYMKIPKEYILNDINPNWSWSFESQVVKMCDEIAQRHHDLEDGIEAKIMSIEEIKRGIKNNFYKFFKDDEIDKFNFEEIEKSTGKDMFLACLSRFIVGFYLRNLIENSVSNLQLFINQYSIDSYNWPRKYLEVNNELDVIQDDKTKIIINELIAFSTEFKEADDYFHNFLKNKIWHSFKVQRMDGIGTLVIKKLFKAYINNPQQLSDKTIYMLFKRYDHAITDYLWHKYKEEDGEQNDDILLTRIVATLREDYLNSYKYRDNFKPVLLRTISDHIAGMTDAYAMAEYQHLYGQKIL